MVEVDWLAIGVFTLAYSTVCALAYKLIPAPHPPTNKHQQYRDHYSSHVSLTHCFVTLIMGTSPASSHSIVTYKLWKYGWDFCGKNNEFYTMLSMVKRVLDLIEFACVFPG